MNFGEVIFIFPCNIRSKIRYLKKLEKKLVKADIAILFNRTCINVNIQHKFTDIYVYKYIYKCTYTIYTRCSTTDPGYSLLIINAGLLIYIYIYIYIVVFSRLPGCCESVAWYSAEDHSQASITLNMSYNFMATSSQLDNNSAMNNLWISGVIALDNSPKFTEYAVKKCIVCSTYYCVWFHAFYQIKHFIDRYTQNVSIKLSLISGWIVTITTFERAYTVYLINYSVLFSN